MTSRSRGPTTASPSRRRARSSRARKTDDCVRGRMAETWDEWTAMIGPWPDADAAERAVRDALEARTLAVRTEHKRGMSIVRVYEIGSGAWVEAETALVAALAGGGRRVFG